MVVFARAATQLATPVDTVFKVVFVVVVTIITVHLVIVAPSTMMTLPLLLMPLMPLMMVTGVVDTPWSPPIITVGRHQIVHVEADVVNVVVANAGAASAAPPGGHVSTASGTINSAAVTRIAIIINYDDFDVGHDERIGR